MPSCIGPNRPSKQHSTLSLAWDQRLRNCKAAPLVHSHGTCITESAPPAATGAHVWFRSPSFSYRSAAVAVAGWHRWLAPREWRRRGHEVRFAQTIIGTARYCGTNHRWLRSRWQPRPTAALLGVCTHVRLSPFAWRQQGMSPRMLPAPPRRTRRSRGHHRLARHEKAPHVGHQRSTRGTSSSHILYERLSRRYRKSPCAGWPLNLNRPRHDQD